MTSVNINLPTGRLVSGHPMEQVQSVDYYTKAKKVDDQGQPKMECFIQIAISKNDPNVITVFNQMEQIANRAMAIDPATGMKSPCVEQSGFSWKITDGDSTRQNVKTGQWIARPDYCLGMWLVNIKAYGHTPTTVYQPVQGGGHQDVVDKRMIKTGDYFDVVISVEPNNAQGSQAGIYVNPQLVRFNMPGEAISQNYGLNASDADGTFSDRPAQTPSPMPVAVPFPPIAPVVPVAAPVVPVAPVAPLSIVPAAPVVVPFPPFSPAPAAIGVPPVVPVAPYIAPVGVPPVNYDPNFANGPTTPGAPIVK